MKTNDSLATIADRLRTQDNRYTENPMFCVQILKRDSGFDASWYENQCWFSPHLSEWIYDDDKDFKEPKTKDGWNGPFGYQDRWETVMAAFTEEGCKQYIERNGHNDRRRAFRGQVRIYVESFNRCAEMIAIREALMAGRFQNP